MNTPAQIAKNYVEAGAAKAKISTAKLFVLAILAGVFISVAGTASSAAAATVESASVAKLITSVVFPAGLAMVVLAGSELFTGNCLLIIPLLEKRISLGSVVKILAVVYLGNLVGSLLFCAIAAYGGVLSLFGQGLAESCVATATAKCNISFLQAFFKGILCNVFVCIAVWMTMAATTVAGKVTALFYPIMVFVLCGFEHCIANMSYIPNGLFAKVIYGIEAPTLTWSAFIVKNLLPVTLGNIVGGMLVGLAYWFVYLHKENQ
jgi:formate/nitrite transporter